MGSSSSFAQVPSESVYAEPGVTRHTDPKGWGSHSLGQHQLERDMGIEVIAGVLLGVIAAIVLVAREVRRRRR
jgi:hypothetical protein